MVSVGDKVSYHGTKEDKHGVYRVCRLPKDVSERDPLWDSDDPERGYILERAESGISKNILENVHRNSFELLIG